MRRSPFDRPARIELLPLMDVIFLLLAVFVYSMLSMVRAHVIPVDLPGLVSGEARDLPAVLLISLDATGCVYLAGQETSLDRVQERLRERRAQEPELAVVLQADREARHGSVALVLDMLHAAGQERILLVGRPLSD